MKKIICLLISITVVFASISVMAFDDGCISIGLEDGGFYTAGELGNVEITSYDACDTIEVWIDYEKYTTLNTSGYIDLSSLNVGRHKMEVKVYNSGELVSGAQVIFYLITKSNGTVWQTDLSDYSSKGTTFPKKVTGSFGSARGTAVILSDSDTDKYGADHGTVVLVKATRSEGNPENGAYFQLDTSCTSVFSVEFDTYISAVPKQYEFRLRYINNGSTMVQRVATVTDTYIYGMNENNCTTYDKDCWYHFKFDIDLNNSLTELTVTKENEIEPIYSSGKETIGPRPKEVNFRFLMSVSAEGQSADIAFDNFSIGQPADSPVITKIGTLDNDDCVIPPEENEICVSLNRILNANTVNKDNITVYNETEKREAEISNVYYDDEKIKISFEEDLSPSSLYKIELSKDVADEYDAKLVSELYDWFETDTSYLDVSDLEIITNGNEKKIKGTMIDRYAAGDPLLLVLSVWDENTLVDIKCKTVTSGDFETDAVTCQSGNTIQFIVIDIAGNRTLIKY